MASRNTRINDAQNRRDWAVDTTETPADRKQTVKILNKVDTAENWASRSSKQMNKNNPTWSLPQETGMPTRVYPRTSAGTTAGQPGAKNVSKLYQQGR